MKINRRTIREHYESLIAHISDEKISDDLLDDLEEIDDLLFSLEAHIENELDYQFNYLPSRRECIVEADESICRGMRLWHMKS